MTANPGAPDQCVTHTTDSGDPTWTRAAEPAVTGVADQLQAIANEHPDDVSGVVICSDAQSVQILIKGSGGEAADQIARVVSTAAAPVSLRSVRFSLEDLLAEQRVLISTAKRKGLPVTGAGPDIVGDGLVVTVSQRADHAEDLVDPDSRASQELSAQLEAAAPLRFRVASS